MAAAGTGVERGMRRGRLALGEIWGDMGRLALGETLAASVVKGGGLSDGAGMSLAKQILPSAFTSL